MEKPASFTVSAYARHQGKVLLINHKLHAWVPIGGRIEPGEGPVEAVKRELREEAGWLEGEHYDFGLGFDPLSPPGLITYEEHDAGPKGWHMNFVFLVEGKTFNVTPCEEYTAFGWYACLDAVEGAIPPNVQVIVQRLLSESLDGDLAGMSHEELLAEARRLRGGIRHHRDATGHALCWYTPELWSLLPEKAKPSPEVPPTAEFLAKCSEYRASLGKP